MTSDRPTKVLVLIPTLRFGGAEMDLARNLPRLDRNRFEVAVHAFMDGGDLAQPLIDSGIEVIAPARSRRLLASRPMGKRLLAVSFLRPAAAVWPYLRLARTVAVHIRKREIDVVHAILPNSYVIGGLATVLARGPALVMSRVSLNWYHKAYPLLGLLERRVLHRLVDTVICNSEAILDNLVSEGVPRDKIRLIPNGIDVAASCGPQIDRKQARNRLSVPEGVLIFVSIANFHAYKGHADLLDALRLARERLPPDWLLLAVGDDIDGNLDRMRRLSDTFGLAKHLRFLGPRGDVETILRAADIHVSASHTEGFPNNVLEAMGAGLPVVATAVGGVPEMVIDGSTGVLVPPRDSERMAQALVQLAHDPDRRRSMGEAARRFVQSAFSLDRSANALAEVYAGGAKHRRSA
jgi:glycosyltransferase involved in cell wall biosynthesis